MEIFSSLLQLKVVLKGTQIRLSLSLSLSLFLFSARKDTTFSSNTSIVTMHWSMHTTTPPYIPQKRYDDVSVLFFFLFAPIVPSPIHPPHHRKFFFIKHFHNRKNFIFKFTFNLHFWFDLNVTIFGFFLSLFFVCFLQLNRKSGFLGIIFTIIR